MKKIIFLMMILMLLPLLSKGQMIPSGEPDISTPDVWSFMKYGGGAPSLYTGTVKTDIPVYTYKDKDFEIPITISYASNGFIANMHSGSLGLGWFLNAGGCITREVVGFPDEKYESGFYSYYKFANKPNLDKPLMDRGGFDGFVGMFINYNNIIATKSDESWETESDVYSFNFHGHSGKFMFGQDEIHVFNTSSPQGEYRIDMSKFIATHELGKERSSEITITTGDGYQYTFGIPYKQSIGTEFRIDDVKVSSHYTTPPPSRQNYVKDYVQKTWMLREIKSPNGRTVTFEYSNPELVESVRFSGQFVKTDWVRVADGWWYPGGKGSTINGFFHDVFKTLGYGIAAVQLTKITVDDILSVDFNYSEREKKETWKRTWLSGPNQMESGMQNLSLWSPQLNSITVKRLNPSPQIIKECKLSYGYPNANGNNVLMLKSVFITGEGTYTMDYYNETSVFPFQGTTSFDHWGYYNLYDSNSDETYSETYLVPKALIDQNFREFLVEPYREPNFEGALYGMLKTLSFPTGGYSLYEYQPHDCSKMVYRDYTSQNKPSLRLCNKTIAGGVRIKKITDYSQTGEVGYSREFVYNDVETGTSSSSGNLLHMPRYWFQTALNNDRQTNWSAIMSITDLQAYSKDGYHMEYGKVYEKFGDGSYIEYNFSNYATIPDQMNIQTQRVYTIDGLIPKFIVTEPQYAYNYLAVPQSLRSQRGKITSKIFYDTSKKRKKSERYRYDTNRNLNYIESVKAFDWSYNNVYLHKTFVEDYPLESISETSYFGNDSLKTEIQFTYNNSGQLIQSISTDGKNNIMIEQSQYVPDLSPSEYIPHIMWTRNIVKYPMRTQTKIKRNGIDSDFKLLKGSRNNYMVSGSGMIVLAQQKQTELSSPATVPDFGFDSLLKLTSQYTYDNMGSLIQYIGRDNIPVIYLWSYEGKYPIAEIKNATFAEVEAVVKKVFSVASIDALSALSVPNETKLKDGSLQKALPDALVTTYTYKPLVGMLTSTDPAGITTYYDYDSFGRLERVYTKKFFSKEIIRSYNYHYQNQ